jgi:probable HAF family extracellular repeat protein
VGHQPDSKQLSDLEGWRARQRGDRGGDTCAGANSINSTGQAVGGSGPCLVAEVHAFLWENGGPIVDLNTLVASNSGVRLLDALFINDRGEIAAVGLLPNGNQHIFLLTPCAAGDAACVSSAAIPTTQSNPALVATPRNIATPANPALTGRGMLDRLRARGFPGGALGAANGPTR